MQSFAIWSHVFELVLSLCLGLLVAFSAFVAMRRTYRSSGGSGTLLSQNSALGTVLSSMILGVGFVAFQALAPIMTAFQTMLYSGIDAKAVCVVFGYVVGFSLAAITVAIIGLLVATRTFFWLTRDIDEVAELEKGNLAVALPLAAVVLVVCLFLGHGISDLFLHFAPYPKVLQLG